MGLGFKYKLRVGVTDIADRCGWAFDLQFLLEISLDLGYLSKAVLLLAISK